MRRGPAPVLDGARGIPIRASGRGWAARRCGVLRRAPRRGLAPYGKCLVVSVLDPQEALVAAALVGVMALGKTQECPLRGPGILLRREAAHPLDGLPVRRLLDCQLALLPLGLGCCGSLLLPGDLPGDGRDPRLGGPEPAAEHLPAIIPGPADLAFKRVADPSSVRQGLTEGIRAVLLSAEIAKQAIARPALIVAVAFDQHSKIAGVARKIDGGYRHYSPCRTFQDPSLWVILQASFEPWGS